MTAYTDMTKSDLNDLVPENLRCKNASQLKKTSKADLIDMLERRDATQAEAQALSKHPAKDAADLTDKEKHVVVALADACMDCNGAETVDDMLADNMTWSDVADIAQRTGMNQKTVKGVLGSLTKRGLVGCDEKPNGQPGTDSFLHDEGIRVAFELLAEGVEAMQSVDDKIRDAKIVKAPKTRKPRELPDRVMIEPGKPEDVRATKAGSKRHLMAEALAKGATVEELMALLSWNKDTVTSAFRTDMGALGFGVERKGGKYFLLFPKKIKRLPVTDKGVSRADALVAACK